MIYRNAFKINLTKNKDNNQQTGYLKSLNTQKKIFDTTYLIITFSS